MRFHEYFAVALDIRFEEKHFDATFTDGKYKFRTNLLIFLFDFPGRETHSRCKQYTEARFQ